MDFKQLIANISPEVYENLKRAIELGKWPDGKRLTPEQREYSLQAVIAYDAQHKPETQRVGYIDRGRKEEGMTCDDSDVIKFIH